ncbi:MAG: c-type cytochrome [Nannocystales bacterium]
MARPCLIFLALAIGCSAEVELRVFGEAYAEQGIEPDEVVGGWALEFSELVVSLDDVRLSPQGEVGDGGYVFDLAADSSRRGHLLATTDAGLGSVNMAHFRVAMPTQVVGGNATAQQIERMRLEKLAFWVSGRASRMGEDVLFAWGIPADISYDCPLSTDVAAGDVARVELTMHADHLFVDDLEVGAEVAFDAIAGADSNSDGSVSAAELGQVSLAGLARYQTGGRRDIDTLWKFIGAASLTMAHVDGEGTCTPRLVPDAFADPTPAPTDPPRAMALYAEHCASCHGDEGRGDGPGAAGVLPAATDLTALRGEASTLPYIAFRIAVGGAMFPYASSMPGYADSLDATDRGLLADYVAGLSGP